MTDDVLKSPEPDVKADQGLSDGSGTNTPEPDDNAICLIVWAYDQTPSIDCDDCGTKLIDDPNGNAPLQFTFTELLNAIVGHAGQCPGTSLKSTGGEV